MQTVPKRLPAWALIAIISTGIIAALVGERIIFSFSDLYMPPDHGSPDDPPGYLDEVRRSMMCNYAIGFGLFGALLIGSNNAIVGFLKSPTRAAAGLLVGAILGAVAFGGAAPIGYWIQDRLSPYGTMEGLLKAVMIEGAIFFIAGMLAGGLAAMLVGRPLVASVTTGIRWAGILLMLHLAFSAIVFPVDRPEAIFLVGMGIRYSSLVCMGLCSALTAVFVTRSRVAPIGDERSKVT